MPVLMVLIMPVLSEFTTVPSESHCSLLFPQLLPVKKVVDGLIK
jgi:hypothetical protein